MKNRRVAAKIQKFTFALILACTLMLIIQSVSADQENDSGKYTFDNYGGKEFTPEPMEFGGNLVNGTTLELSNETNRKHVLLQFYSIPSAEQQELLEEYGVEYVGSAAEYTYIFSMPAIFTPADLSTESGIRWMGEIPAESKYDPVFGLNAPEWARTEDGQVEVELNFYKDVTSEEALIIAKKYTSSTPQLYGSSYVVYSITTDEKNITLLAKEDTVQYVLFPPSESEPDLSENISGEIEGTHKRSSGFQFVFTALMILCAIVYCRKK